MNYGRPPPDMEGMTSLKVDNLTNGTSPETLRRVFKKYGRIGDMYMPWDRYTKKSRGFAFVGFHDKRDAEDAMAAMHGAKFHGRYLHVQMVGCSPPDSHYGRRGGGPHRRYGGYGRRSRSRSGSHRRRRRSGSRSRSRCRSRSRYSAPDPATTPAGPATTPAGPATTPAGPANTPAGPAPTPGQSSSPEPLKEQVKR